MSRLKAVAALLVLIVTNAFVLGGVAWNRSGEPTGRIVLDQCDVNSFKNWSGRHKAPRYMFLWSESGVVDAETLEDLYGTDWAADNHAKWFERRLYVVLKHGGPEWEEFVERRGQREPDGLYDGREPRLITVGGDVDPGRLLEKYAETEGRAIVAGYIGRRQWIVDRSRGRYWDTASDRIAIESQYRDVVEGISDARRDLEERARGPARIDLPPCEPTHRITVNWGRRFEPWISSIEAM